MRNILLSFSLSLKQESQLREEHHLLIAKNYERFHNNGVMKIHAVPLA